MEADREQVENHQPKFVSGETVLVKIDPRKHVKLQYPWVKARVVRYAGRGSYLLSDEKGKEAYFHERSLAKYNHTVPLERTGDDESPIQDVTAEEQPPVTALEEPARFNQTVDVDLDIDFSPNSRNASDDEDTEIFLSPHPSPNAMASERSPEPAVTMTRRSFRTQKKTKRLIEQG